MTPPITPPMTKCDFDEGEWYPVIEFDEDGTEYFVPVAVLENWKRIFAEFADAQTEMKKYWIRKYWIGET